jgi:hypothetical protein
MNTVRIADVFEPAAVPADHPAPAMPVAHVRASATAVNEHSFHPFEASPLFEASSPVDRRVCALLAVLACGAVFTSVLALFAQPGM